MALVPPSQSAYIEEWPLCSAFWLPRRPSRRSHKVKWGRSSVPHRYFCPALNGRRDARGATGSSPCFMPVTSSELRSNGGCHAYHRHHMFAFCIFTWKHTHTPTGVFTYFTFPSQRRVDVQLCMSLVRESVKTAALLGPGVWTAAWAVKANATRGLGVYGRARKERRDTSSPTSPPGVVRTS